MKLTNHDPANEMELVSFNLGVFAEEDPLYLTLHAKVTRRQGHATVDVKMQVLCILQTPAEHTRADSTMSHIQTPWATSSPKPRNSPSAQTACTTMLDKRLCLPAIVTPCMLTVGLLQVRGTIFINVSQTFDCRCVQLQVMIVTQGCVVTILVFIIVQLDGRELTFPSGMANDGHDFGALGAAGCQIFNYEASSQYQPYRPFIHTLNSTRSPCHPCTVGYRLGSMRCHLPSRCLALPCPVPAYDCLRARGQFRTNLKLPAPRRASSQNLSLPSATYWLGCSSMIT